MRLKNKIPNITTLATTTGLNTKINKVKNKIPYIANLAINTDLIAAEKEISNVSNLVKKTNCDTKNSKIGNKITTYHDHIMINILLLKNLIR